MSVLLWIPLFLLLVAGSVIAFARVFQDMPEMKTALVPFCVLPVREDTPEVRAFLEYYVSQAVWTDSELISSVWLIYPEQAPEIQAFCENLSRKYDFLISVSCSEAQSRIGESLQRTEIL